MMWRNAADVRDIQSELLRATMSRVALQHPHYRKVFAEAEIDPTTITSLADLDRIPLTTKADLVADPESFRLVPDPESPQEYVLWDVAYTAGTTNGRPTPMYQSSYDFRAVLFAQKRMAEIREITSADRIANLYPLAPYPHGGWIRPTQAAAVVGASVVVGMSGAYDQAFPVTRRLDEIVTLIADADVTIIWGVPSYLLRVLDRVSEMGARLPSLRMIAISGEPCHQRMRAALIERSIAAGASAPYVSDSLGATELQFSLVECPAGEGFHNPAPELAHICVVDDEGRTLPSGEPGRLVFTHLDKRGSVLLRFLVGDRAITDDGPCPGCGWLGGRVVAHLGREGRFVKIRGNIVSLDALFAVLDGAVGISDYRITLAKPADDPLSMDRLTIEIAFAPGQSCADGEVHTQIAAAVRAAISVTPEVKSIAAEELVWPDDRIKPVRFVDRRPTE